MSLNMQMAPVSNEVIEETYGSSSYKRRFIRNTAGKILVFKTDEKFQSVSHFFRSTVNVSAYMEYLHRCSVVPPHHRSATRYRSEMEMQTVFLPQGYPDSVSGDYLVYQLWDTIQAFASSITGTLAAQALLKGVGVGDESATVLAATLTWLLKDGTGMAGRIMFAWLQGSNLDCDAKRWRLFADILNDMAIFLEILAPTFQSMFTVIVCTAGVFKSIVGVAGGATRAALTQHQARRNNMADVSAKDGSQETLVNLAALICSFLLVPIVTGKTMLIWTLYIMFTCLHLYANYSAVTSVIMESINQSRLHILLQEYFKNGTILSTKNVNYKEPVLWRTRKRLQIKLGASFQDLCDQGNVDIENLREIYTGKYILCFTQKQGHFTETKGVTDSRDISICLLQDAELSDQLMACYQAELLEFIHGCRQSQIHNSQYQELIEADHSGDDEKLLSLSYQFTLDTFSMFVEQLHSHGWRTDVTLLGADEWRLNFETDDDELLEKKNS